MGYIGTLTFATVLSAAITVSQRPNATICGGYCVTGKDPFKSDCFDHFHGRNGEYQQCQWALKVCCPPNGNGSQWTTTTTTTTTTTPSTTAAPKKDESILKHWKIILIVLGVILGLALIGGVAYFLYRKICSKNKSVSEQRYTPPPLETPESNYAYAEENPNFGTSDDFYGASYS